MCHISLKVHLTTLCFVYVRIALAYIQPIIKLATLTPSNLNSNGVSVIPNVAETKTNTNNEWEATINTQSTWQFAIDFDERWSFNPHNTSTLKLTLHSNSSTNDILFGVTTNNDKFFSIWLPMNNNGRKNRIHPACDTSVIPKTTFASGDISNLPNQQRICDIAPGNGEHGCLYSTMRPKNAQNPNVFAYNAFPIKLTLVNNPNRNTFFITYHSALFTTNFSQKCGFVAITNTTELSIFIGGNEIGDTFSISSFDVEYYTISTLSPQTTSDSISSEVAADALQIKRVDIPHNSKQEMEYMIIGMSILAVFIVMIVSVIFFMYCYDVYNTQYYDCCDNIGAMEVIGGAMSCDDSLSDLSDDDESEDKPKENAIVERIRDVLDFNNNEVPNFMENGRMFDVY